jgi:hypothetical protein
MGNQNKTPWCIKELSKHKLFIIKTVLIRPMLNKGLLNYIQISKYVADATSFLSKGILLLITNNYPTA